MICIEAILGCKTIETAVGVDPALKPHYGNGGSMTNVFTPTLATLHRPTCAQCGCSYSAMYTTQGLLPTIQDLTNPAQDQPVIQLLHLSPFHLSSAHAHQHKIAVQLIISSDSPLRDGSNILCHHRSNQPIYGHPESFCYSCLLLIHLSQNSKPFLCQDATAMFYQNNQ